SSFSFGAGACVAACIAAEGIKVEATRFPSLAAADFSVALGTMGLVEATKFPPLLAEDFSVALGAIGLVEATCPGFGACDVAVCAGLGDWSILCFIWSTMVRNCSISFCCSAICCFSSETSSRFAGSFDEVSAVVCEKTGVASAIKTIALAISMLRVLMNCILQPSDSNICVSLGSSV